MVALDSEVSNSTFTEEFKNAYPDRFFEMFIAEQQLVSAAVGLAVLGKRVVASTFAAFFTRAFDQIRMAALSNATLHLVGSHCGVSIGQDGPSQMGLEDLAMMRTVRGSTVLYPCDPNQTAALVARDGGLARHLLPPHDAGEDAGDLPARRTVPGGRQQARQALRPGPGRGDRRGHHRA